MAIEHSQSRLLLKNMTPVLPEGMLLFPLDGNIGDTTQSIPVSMNVRATQRIDKYRFMSSTAIEPSTTNLASSVAWGAYVARYDGKFPMNNPHGVPYVQKYTCTSTASTPRGIKIVPGIAGKTYAGSVVMKLPPNGVAYVSAYKSSPEAGSTITMTTLYEEETKLGDGWVKYDFVVRVDVNSNPNCIFMFGNSTRVIDESFYAYNLQWEEKSFNTSYTEGSVGSSKLKYDISSLEMKDAGCISCWIYQSPNMVNMYSGNNQYFLKLGSFRYNDWSDDSVFLTTQSTAPRRFSFTTTSTTDLGIHANDNIRASFDVVSFPVGSWNHFVIQWDKKGLPTGSKKELYINGKLEASNLTDSLPNNLLTYLHIGSWYDGDDGLMPSTMFEQLSVHPRRGFSPEEIKIWYMVNAPFFDPQDSVWDY